MGLTRSLLPQTERDTGTGSPARRCTMPGIIVLVSLVAILWSGRPAAALCLPPEPLSTRLAEAPLVFVGTVLSTTNNDRVARVRVEEVWRGPKLSNEVEVRGTPFTVDENAATSVDRSFRTGVRYLFVPRHTGDASSQEIAAAPLEDGLCTATQEYRAELEEFRPASVTTPAAPAGEAEGPSDRKRRIVLSVAATGTLALAAIATWGWQRRRG